VPYSDLQKMLEEKKQEKALLLAQDQLVADPPITKLDQLVAGYFGNALFGLVE
jgi:hypothetical protein